VKRVGDKKSFEKFMSLCDADYFNIYKSAGLESGNGSNAATKNLGNLEVNDNARAEIEKFIGSLNAKTSEKKNILTRLYEEITR